MKKILKKIIINILTFEAKLILRKYNPKIIAITGSVGKTSTKDAVYEVLKNKFSARKSQKSYNSEFGVPLTIIGAESGWHKPYKWLLSILKGLGPLIKKNNYPEILVLEIGADRSGDIEKLCRWIKPDISIVTTLGSLPVHIEFFSGLEELIREKSKIVRCLETDNWAVLNNDDETVLNMKEKTKARILTYGINEGSDILGSNYHIIYKENIPEGITFKVDVKGSSMPVRLTNTFGRHHVFAALAAFAVGSILNLNLIDVSELLSQYSAPPGRLKLIKGVKNTWILDDTYNASPASVSAALDTLKDISVNNGGGRKVAVLGDMLELGKYAIDAHRVAGKEAGSVADILFLVGPRAKFIADSAREQGMKPENIFEFSDSKEAGRKLQEIIQEGDMVLVKGSQGMRMERVVESIMAEPDKKAELLVRQEKEWQKR